MAEFVRHDREIIRWADDDGVIHEAENIKTSIVRKPIKEEKFIKIYYDTYLAALGKNPSLMSEFLIVIGKYMSISSTGDYQVVNLNKYNKELIAAELGRSLVTIERLIGECIKSEILVRIGKGRTATYAVSPFVLSKSRSTEIEGLQLAYNARLGQMQLAPTTKPKELAKMENQGFEAVKE